MESGDGEAGMRVEKIRKLNQKGMTLVEVVVAMAILAIVIVPTLRIFASTSGTNLGSRKRQRATSVAESTMEKFKAYDMEALCKQFKGGTFEGVESVSGTTSMSVYAEYGGTDVDPFRDDFSLRDDADAYKFHVEKAVSQGTFYNVDVLVTPDIAENVLKMDDINAYSDAIIYLEEDTAGDALDKIKEEAQTQLETALAAESPAVSSVDVTDFKRVIDLVVDDNGVVQTVKLKLTYTAQAKVNYTSILAPSTTSTTYDMTYEFVWDDATGDKELKVYDNTDTISGALAGGARKCKLNQIFLYYYPIYPSVFGTGAKEEINISGTLSGTLYDDTGDLDPKAHGLEPLKVIVAKQATQRLTDVDLDIGEVAYNVSVENTLGGGGKAVLHHNYDVNLSPIDSAIPSPYIQGFTDEGDLSAKAIDRVVLLYKVEIHVYDDETGKEVAYFEGTMNE